MSDKARKRTVMRCNRCSQKTVHVVYPSNRVCTACNQPNKINPNRRK